uniref:Fibronectin type-III domain-containing protein n=1 Tax=Panagrolaimus sp. ES5 TaxID=591445 RepID=A0AC34G2M0_9BILA
MAFNGTENISPKYKTEQSLIRESDGIEIIQLVIDGIQERIYAVRNQSGLIRCSFNNCLNATVLTTNSISYIERIAVDYWNGFLYYSTANGDVFIATLFPWQAPSTYSFNIQRRIAQIPQIFSMEINYDSQQLIAVLKNGTLIAMNLINQNVTNIRQSLGETEKYNLVKKQKFVENRLFWISSDCGDDHEWKSCLYGEEKDPDSNVIHLNRYLYPGPVIDLTILQDLPNPTYLMPPEKVSLIISGKEAKATWLPPISLPFQASGNSWRNLKYDYKLIEVSTSTVLDHSQTSETEAFLNSKITKATNYTIFVKVCIQKIIEDSFHFCSKPVSTSVMTPGLFSTIPTFPSVVAYISNTENGENENLKMIDILGRNFENVDEN